MIGLERLCGLCGVRCGVMFPVPFPSSIVLRYWFFERFGILFGRGSSIVSWCRVHKVFGPVFLGELALSTTA